MTTTPSDDRPKVELLDLLDAVEAAGGGLSGDEPAMGWPIFIGDEHRTNLQAGKVEVVDGRITLRLRPDFKIGLTGD